MKIIIIALSLEIDISLDLNHTHIKTLVELCLFLSSFGRYIELIYSSTRTQSDFLKSRILRV